MLQRLAIALLQVKAGYTLYLLNDYILCIEEKKL